MKVKTATLALLMSALVPLTAQAEQVVVFAAASLKTALDGVAADFTQQTGHEVVISYAGSNVLAKQIIDGAPADLFVSAAVNWMDEVETAGLIAEGARKDLLGNALVLIAHGAQAEPVQIDAQFDLKARLAGGKLAMAMVDAVPAGQYGKAALEQLGLWQAVAPDVAQADNVRAALALVARGEAPLGITYATDAGASDEVTVIGAFPPDSYPPVVYPAALLRGAVDGADRAFYDYLSQAAAGEIFTAQGFTLLPQAGAQ